MQQHNETWCRTVYSPATYICPLCIGNPPSFVNRDKLSQHLTSEHQSANFDDRQLSIIACQSQGFKDRPKDECLLCGFVVESEDQKEVSSKRESKSRRETSTKRLKTGQLQSVPAATSSNDPEKDGHEERKNEHMARHIAAHLQTLMFLTLRVISMQQGVGSDDEDEAESNAGTNDVQDYQGSNHSDGPPSFEDANRCSDIPWLPAAEPYFFNFVTQERTVFIHPTLEIADIFDTSIKFPNSSTVQEIISHMETLLAIIEQNGRFYHSSIGALESTHHGISQWQCVSYSKYHIDFEY